jgi:predicted nucleic acid-binding Zn ribbon protein
VKRGGASQPRRGGEFRPLGGVLEQVLAGLKLEERFQAARATDEWALVVGPEVLQRTRPVGVRDGVLLVEVQGAVWMGHLAVLRRGILDSLNERLPETARLKSIRLVPMRSKEEPIESES